MPLQAGYDKAVFFKPDGGAEQTLDVVDHSWKEMVDAIDVTHTGTNGLQALLAGILRGDGTIKAVLNTSQNPAGPDVALRAGATGMIEFDYGFDVPFTVPCLVVDLLHQSQVAGRVEWTCSVKLSKLSGTGAYTRQS